MAMIFPVELAPGDQEKIAGFLNTPEGQEPVMPELGEKGMKALDALTTEQAGSWRTVLGRFVAYEELPDNVTHADHLYDADGKDTGLQGVVQSDHAEPEGVFVVGVPV